MERGKEYKNSISLIHIGEGEGKSEARHSSLTRAA